MNPYAIPPLITCIILASIGIFVFLKNRTSKLNIIFSLFSFSMAVWLFGYTNMYLSKDPSVALKWARIGFLGIIFVPVFAYHFIIAFLNLRRRIVLPIIYLLSIPSIFLSQTDFIYGGIKEHFWGYYPTAGKVYIAFLLMFGILFTRGVLLLFTCLKKEGGIKKEQIKYVCLAFGLGTFGIVDYLIKYPVFDVYPFGYVCALLFNGLIAFANIPYRLLDIKVVLTRAGIFVIVYTLVLGIPFWLGYKYKLWLHSTWVMLALATLGPFIYTSLRRQADARMRSEERHAHELLRQASKGMVRYRNMKELLGLINHITSKTLKLENAAVFLVEENSGNFNLAAVRQKSKYHYLEKLNSNDALVQKLSTMEEPLVYEEVKLKAQEQKSNPDDPIHEIESQMRKLSAAVIVPALSKGRLLGFLVLGEKKSKRMYSPDDLATLWVLSYQAALAIENARLYEKEKIWLAEQSKRQALGEMAPGASHQFDNRLSTISATADNLIDLIKNDSQSFSKEQLIDTVSSELEVIRGEVTKGKQITEAILQRAKVKLEFDKVNIIKVIQNAINLTKLRRTRESLAGAKEPEFVFNYPEGLPLFTLCEGPIQDVFENMFNNSTDAVVIKEKRKIEPLGYQGKITINVLQKDKSLIIQIEDNGIGIQKENLHKLFTSFFTTKATSEKGVVGGSGLGLSVMRGFVEDHGGTISIESEYTKWTRFTITLPIDFKPPK